MLFLSLPYSFQSNRTYFSKYRFGVPCNHLCFLHIQHRQSHRDCIWHKPSVSIETAWQQAQAEPGHGLSSRNLPKWLERVALHYNHTTGVLHILLPYSKNIGGKKKYRWDCQKVVGDGRWEWSCPGRSSPGFNAGFVESHSIFASSFPIIETVTAPCIYTVICCACL